MADSDEENDNEECVNLTGFLFGNIDETGQLEGDVFDSDTQRQLSSLGKLGFQSMLKEIVGKEKIYEDSDSDGDYDEADFRCESENYFNETQNELTEKLSSAIDYSDINELAEEESCMEINNFSGMLTNDKKLMPPPPPVLMKQDSMEIGR
ncbi:hypothetical protein AMK59_5189, partial [Oryctes borbonicus]